MLNCSYYTKLQFNTKIYPERYSPELIAIYSFNIYKFYFTNTFPHKSVSP